MKTYERVEGDAHIAPCKTRQTIFVHNSKKRSKVFQNVRIFVNTITKAVETMQAVGIAAESQKIQHEDYIEYRVKIPTATAAAGRR